MSSGLEVQESARAKSWVGKRVWINLSALGFESLHRGSALVQNEGKKLLDDDDGAPQQGSGDDSGGGRQEEPFSEQLHEEYREQLRAKSRWIQHVSLRDDMKTERDGIRVRCIEGLEAVDYLTPGALTNHVSYVFGPVIRALQQQAGYVEQQNLDAAPYDWRVPPSELEQRDGYFTATMRKVERLYRQNSNTPVVLLCHSLGCRTAHYFLNFVLMRQHDDDDDDSGGRAWLDRYIHTYMPVGAPHLGAPKALRAMISGDKMGLDAFLKDEEGLVLGRSFGSGAWLLPSPTTLPKSAIPSAFKRQEGILQVTIARPIDCASFLDARKADPSSAKFRLVVVLDNKKILTSEYTTFPEKGSRLLTFSESFRFALPGTAKPVGQIEIRLQEKGVLKEEKKLKRGLYYSFLCCPVRLIINLIVCIIKFTLLLPCTLLGGILRSVLGLTRWTVKKTLKAAGAYTTLASTLPITVQNVIKNNGEGETAVSLVHSQEYQTQARCSSRGESRNEPILLKLSWSVEDDDVIDDTLASSRTESIPLCFYGKKGKSDYRTVLADGLLKSEGLDNALALIKECYDTDEIGPLSISSSQPPPVRRVKAVYGINLPTEVGAVYRRTNIIPLEGHVQGLHELDSSVRLSANLSAKSGYRVKDGIVYEHRSTPQIIHGSNETVNRSGDGTVPYWSLQHSRTWQGPCDVTVDEIEGAEHREILADERFHSILMDYLQQV